VKVATVSLSKCLFGLPNPFPCLPINQSYLGLAPRPVLGTALGDILGVELEDEMRAAVGVALSEELAWHCGTMLGRKMEKRLVRHCGEG
jgi:hypothetical protein